MRVRKGYKPTDLEEIPEAWHFETFGEIMKVFQVGELHHEAEYLTGKIPWITSGELIQCNYRHH